VWKNVRRNKGVSVMDVRTDGFTDNCVAFSFKCIIFGYFLFTFTEKNLRVKERIYTVQVLCKSVKSKKKRTFSLCL